MKKEEENKRQTVGKETKIQHKQRKIWKSLRWKEKKKGLGLVTTSQSKKKKRKKEEESLSGCLSLSLSLLLLLRLLLSFFFFLPRVSSISRRWRRGSKEEEEEEDVIWSMMIPYSHLYTIHCVAAIETTNLYWRQIKIIKKRRDSTIFCKPCRKSRHTKWERKRDGGESWDGGADRGKPPLAYHFLLFFFYF